MLYRNHDSDRAFTFIATSNFDIFCLQEVSGSFLKRLQTLPFFIAFHIERIQLVTGNQSELYGVILSKHPIAAQGEVLFPTHERRMSWRTRLFYAFMSSRLFTTTWDRKGFFIDITKDGMPIRIFNLHLALSHPSSRLAEFEAAMTELDSKPTVVCGDFNILETPHIAPLNWIFGGRIRDAIFYTRERTHIEKRFIAYELRNALRGKSTHPLSRSQLDHILVSNSFSISNTAVIPDRYGSDHHPIHVSVT